MIKVGDQLPAVTLSEYSEVEGNGCSLGPNPVDVRQAAAGKTIAIFAVPGAFTPTCSAKHVPSYLQNAEALKAAGVDEIWCLAVNDPFVMAAWAKDQGTGDKVMMLGDGNGEFTEAMGLVLDATRNGLGRRSQRYAMVVEDGVIKGLCVEKPGMFGVSASEAVLKRL